MNNSIDPDLNLQVPEILCQYYDQNEFVNAFKSNTNTMLLRINARSLPQNISSIFSHRDIRIMVESH